MLGLQLIHADKRDPWSRQYPHMYKHPISIHLHTRWWCRKWSQFLIKIPTCIRRTVYMVDALVGTCGTLRVKCSPTHSLLFGNNFPWAYWKVLPIYMKNVLCQGSLRTVDRNRYVVYLAFNLEILLYYLLTTSLSLLIQFTETIIKQYS